MKNNMLIKVNESYEKVEEILEANKFSSKESKFVLDIYMVETDITLQEINTIEELSSYIIVEDINGEQKKLILKSNKISEAKVSDIMLTKSIFDHMGYKELININIDTKPFRKRGISITLNSLKDGFIFIDAINEINKEKIIALLDKYNLNYELGLDVVNSVLKTMKEKDANKK